MSDTNKPIPVGRIFLKNVRLSFPALWKAEIYKPGDEPKFKATFLIPHEDPQVAIVEAKILAVLKEAYPQRAAAILKSIRGNANKFCWADGDTKEYDGWQGMMALSAKSKSRPTVLDRDAVTPLSVEDGRPYAGCYVDASLDIFAYDSSGVGVSASLRGVMFRKDGVAFSGGGAADASEFEAAEEGADADDIS